MGTIEIIKYILIAIAVIYGLFLIISSYIKTRRFFEGKNGVKFTENFHTHTTFCDGENEPSEVVESAIQQGLTDIGFSSHSHLPMEPSWSLSKEKEGEYKKEILRLKEAYKGKINVHLGIEQDYWSDTSNLSDYDYIIGSVHSLLEEDTTWSSIDYSYENFDYCVEHYFGGDKMAAVERYFELVGNLYEQTHCDIIGHFDLITIFNEMYFKENGFLYVDTEDERYKVAEDKALRKLVATPVIFEINTGAIIRGKRTTPYPSERVLQYLSEHKTPVILSSDAHQKDALTRHFDEAYQLVKKYNLNLVKSPRNEQQKTTA